MWSTRPALGLAVQVQTGSTLLGQLGDTWFGWEHAAHPPGFRGSLGITQNSCQIGGPHLFHKQVSLEPSTSFKKNCACVPGRQKTPPELALSPRQISKSCLFVLRTNANTAPRRGHGKVPRLVRGALARCTGSCTNKL